MPDLPSDAITIRSIPFLLLLFQYGLVREAEFYIGGDFHLFRLREFCQLLCQDSPGAPAVIWPLDLVQLVLTQTIVNNTLVQFLMDHMEKEYLGIVLLRDVERLLQRLVRILRKIRWYKNLGWFEHMNLPSSNLISLRLFFSYNTEHYGYGCQLEGKEKIAADQSESGAGLTQTGPREPALLPGRHGLSRRRNNKALLP